jgi:CubicO group peptidase (beta-lactamase class C family)
MSGTSFVALAHREIIAPLNLDHTFFNPGIGVRARIAASEKGNVYERETASETEKSTSAVWRENVIWGEVHDGNAYFLGGAAGHAGLFSTAQETLRLALQFIAGHTRLLKAETCELFRTNMTAGLEEARSIGWQLAISTDSAAGPDLPPESFGHSGFTGTSCWIDPRRERVFILLTNRTHARALPFTNINSIRRRFHTLAVTALEKLSG